MSWFTRLVLRLLPQSWQTTVESDLTEDAARNRHGSFWRAWEALRIAAAWRGSFGTETFFTDLKYAIRGLVHARWFTIGAVFTFALGIGVNAAVFSMVDRMLLRPLPYARPDELVLLLPTGPDGRIYTRTPKALAVYAKAQPGLFAGLATAGQSSTYRIDPVADDDPGVRLTSATYNVLTVLGVHPVLGRDFERADAIRKASVALISYEVWQKRFGGREDVLGRRLGKASDTEIIGVLPRGFVAPSMFWISESEGLSLDPDLIEAAAPREGIWPIFARLAPGVSRTSAQAAVDVICARVSLEAATAAEGADGGLRVTLEGVREGMFHNLRAYLWLVACAAVLVLLVACANLSGLLLARGRSREHLAALKTALGASTGRLITASLLECGLVAGAGAVVAITVLAWSGHALVALEPIELQQYAVEATDSRVLAIMLAVVVGCVFVAGLWPAIRTSRVDVQGILQQGTKTGRRTRSGAARGLLVAEAALAMVLVAGAVLTGRSLAGLLHRDMGFVSADLHIVYPAIGAQESVSTKMAMYDRVLDLLRADPAVVGAGGIDVFTIGTNTAYRGFPSVSGPRAPRSETYLYQVTGGYFETIGARIVAGRAITDDDGRHGRLVAVLSESGARLLWPSEPPQAVIGHPFKVPNEADRVVVGVVADQRATSMRPAIAAAYVPYGQGDPKVAARLARMDVVVRTRPGSVPNLSLLRSRARQEFAQFTPTMRDVTSQLNPAIAQPKFQSYLFASFAVIALVLSAGGLYAVASLDVALRRHEMGVRMALGANTARLRQMVIFSSLGPVAAGVGLGLVGAWWAGQFLQSLLAEGDAHDPLMLAVSAAILLAAAVVAAWIPASRAARTDPVVVLRE